MKRARTVLFLLLILSCVLLAESLIPEGFRGHLGPGGFLSPGDPLLIHIDQDMEFKIHSTRSSSNSIVFELRGGEGAGLLSFLPSGTSSGSRVLRSEEAVSLDTLLPVRITEITAEGLGLIQGSRSIRAEGGRQELSLSGVVYLAEISPGQRVPFGHVLDARLEYRSIAAAGETRISDADLHRPLALAPDQALLLPEQTELPLALAEQGGEDDEDMEDPDAPMPAVPPEPHWTTLDPERQRELFIRYINEFIRLVFM